MLKSKQRLSPPILGFIMALVESEERTPILVGLALYYIFIGGIGLMLVVFAVISLVKEPSFGAIGSLGIGLLLLYFVFKTIKKQIEKRI